MILQVPKSYIIFPKCHFLFCWPLQAVKGALKFKHLDTKRTREGLVPTANAAESGEESEEDAQPVTGVQEWVVFLRTQNMFCDIFPIQLDDFLFTGMLAVSSLHAMFEEYQTLKRFGDSLLSKNTKLQEMAGQLDEANSEPGPHSERIKKYST